MPLPEIESVSNFPISTELKNNSTARMMASVVPNLLAPIQPNSIAIRYAKPRSVITMVTTSAIQVLTASCAGGFFRADRTLPCDLSLLISSFVLAIGVLAHLVQETLECLYLNLAERNPPGVCL